MGLSALTSLASIANQFGEAKNAATEEKQARADKLKSMDVQDAYLQIAKQAEARQGQEFEQRKKAGDLIEFKDGRIWSVSQNKFIDQQRPDPMNSLKEVMAHLDPRIKTKAESHAHALVDAYPNDPQGLIRKVLDDVGTMQRQLETEDATAERAKASREAADKRAEKSRESASKRQQAGFAEREKLNPKVLGALGDRVDADNRIIRMEADLADAEAAEKDPQKHPDGTGAFDMDMLSQHVALTFGAIKGGMRSKAMIDEHRNAVALLEKIKRAYQSGVRGSQLSPEQRRNFLKLGRIAQQAAHDKYDAIKGSVQGDMSGGGDVGVPGEEPDTE
jgi:hypothetical protein